jgi:hypothetical protein
MTTRGKPRGIKPKEIKDLAPFMQKILRLFVFPKIYH